jgi:signal transduction histidine kinase
LTVTAVTLVTVQRRQLIAGADATLEQRADDLTAPLAAGDRLPAQLSEGLREGVAQLVATDGSVIAASPNLAGRPALSAGPGSGRTQLIRTRSGLPVADDDDDEFRILSRRVQTPAGPAVLHLGVSLDDINEGTAVLGSSLAATIPLVVALLTVLVWWLAGRVLAPVEGIRAEVAEIGGTDLHRRVRQPAGDDEVSRLARTMNKMLDRLADAVGRQQRFVADASHELRSPLTRIRTELEVDLASTETADLAATHRSVLEEVVDLQRLVDDLLQLARADAGVAPTRGEPVDLDDLVLREVRRVRAAGRVELDIAGVSGAQVVGDPDQLTRAVRNLVDNAERHAAGRVVLTLAEIGGVAQLTVGNDGSGIPADQRERIFERFGRLDDARTRHAGGAGLGLAITREIVERHGGTIAVDPASQTGARFVVRLPAAPAR